MSNFDEMVGMLEHVGRINRVVTLPFVQKKTGLRILDQGQDHGMIVTEADRNVSAYLLDGGLEGTPGVRQSYPGSFSEESDTPERLSALELIEVDPIDGTGDFVDTYSAARVVGPTTLVTKLQRSSPDQPFRPVAGFIFDILHGIALLSDGKDIGLYKLKDGKLLDASYKLVQPEPWNSTRPVRINRRLSYPQLTFDGPFMDYLQKNMHIERVPVGGAGIFALQVFRNFVEPTDDLGRDFRDLEHLTIGFNAQPDWKTWDVDPTEVIATALGFPPRTDIYGQPLRANAANPTLRDMHHTTGYVLSPHQGLQNTLVRFATEFTQRNSDCPLTKKDYAYKDAILHLGKPSQ